MNIIIGEGNSPAVATEDAERSAFEADSGISADNNTQKAGDEGTQC